MILFFHFICLLARYIASSLSKSISKIKVISDDENETDSLVSQSSDYLQTKKGFLRKSIVEDGTVKFFPPVYVQRYETVAIILQDPIRKGKIRKVVDFGCAEMGFFMYLKNMEGVNEVLEVDIDEEILMRFAVKAAPLTSDYIKTKSLKPLDVYILAGSIADYDDHLIGTDVVIAIELIEHLSEEAFNKMPYNVFHNIKPRLAIFTTPNADFNSLFPNFTGKRHIDHKFEWTRQEFFNWTQKIIKQYPEYFVRFYGVGAGPEGTENLGCCSQMAVFYRHSDSEGFSSAREEAVGIHNYKLVKHYKYPFYVDTRTKEEKILHEIQYQVSNINALPTYYNHEENECEIPLTLLKDYVADLCTDEEELRNILKNNGMKLRKKSNSWFLVYVETEDSSSEIGESEEDWLNEKIPVSVGLSTDTFENWDLKDPLEESNFESARSLEELELKLTRRNELNVEKPRVSTVKCESASESCNQLVRQFGPAKSFCSNKEASNEQVGVSLSPTASKIPRMRNGKEGAQNRSVSSIKKTSLSHVRNRSCRKIAKSYSLDSCLENINFKPSESFSNLIPSGSLSFRYGKRVINDSGSSLFSSSLERAPDSGYPFSFSPADADLTPEQVDELFTENEMSRSTSASSEDEIVNVVDRRIRGDLFHEDAVVENGDLANNNRDGEGNNVEGLLGQRLVNEMAAERDPNDNMMFFAEVEEFPPWLLNLGGLAQRPVVVPPAENDEGVVDDSSSDFNPSPEPEDVDFY